MAIPRETLIAALQREPMLHSVAVIYLLENEGKTLTEFNSFCVANRFKVNVSGNGDRWYSSDSVKAFLHSF